MPDNTQTQQDPNSILSNMLSGTKNPVSNLSDTQAEALRSVLSGQAKKQAQEAVMLHPADQLEKLLAVHDATTGGSGTSQSSQQSNPTQTLQNILPQQNPGGPANPNDPLQQQAQQIALEKPGFLMSIFRGTYENDKKVKLENLKTGQEITQGGPPISPEQSANLDVNTYKSLTDNAMTASTNEATKLSDYIKLYQEQSQLRSPTKQFLGGPTSQMNDTMSMIDASRQALNAKTDQLKTLHENPPRNVGKPSTASNQTVNNAKKNQPDKQALAVSGKLKSGMGFKIINQ